MNPRAFTLIELLVVLAIIGVLSTVVLALLTRPRGQSADAAIKANLHSIIQQSVIYYDGAVGNQSYGTVTTVLGTNAACSAAGSLFLDTVITNALNGADKNSKLGVGSITCSVGKNGVAAGTANTKAQDWAVYVPLTYPTSGTGWCADATGIAKASAALPNSGPPYNYDCP